MTLLPIKSTRNTFPGISVQGSATISQDAFISGSLNANIVGKFPIGDGLDLQHGTLSSTVTGGGGTTTILSGTNIQVGGGTVSVVDSPNFSGTVVSNGIIVLATVTGSSPPAVTFSSPTVGPTIALGITPVGTTQTGATIVYGAFDRYTVASGVSTLLSLSDLFILGNNTASTIRSYNSYEYHITVPLTVDQVKSMPLGSGLASANGTIYATGGASSSITPQYIVSDTGTLFIGANIPSITGSVVSSTISIINSSTVDTQTDFQQKVSVDFANTGLSSYANSTLTNIQFSDISGSTILPSWRESGSLSTDTAIYWVKLSGGVPASSTIYAKINVFTDKSNKLNTTDTGVNPALLYGYDTGSILFDTYQYWGSITALPSDWSLSGDTANATVTFNTDSSALSYTGTSTEGVYLTSTLSSTLPIAWDMYGNFYQNNNPTGKFMGLWTNIDVNPYLSGAAQLAILGGFNGVATLILASYSGSVSNGSVADTDTNKVYTIVEWDTSTVNLSGAYYLNYGNTSSSLAPTNTNGVINYQGFNGRHGSGGDTSDTTIVWSRTRKFVSVDNLPSAQVSTITGIPTIEFQSGIKFVNGPASAASTLISYGSVVGGPVYTVSNVGTTTSSTIAFKNNGADYGPDTVRNGTLTQTYGIQEGVLDIFAAGGGAIWILPGVYDITSARFQPVSTTEYAQIVIPGNDLTSGNPTIPIAVVGAYNGASREFNTAENTNGVTIYSKASGTNSSYSLFAAGSSSNPRSDITLRLDQILFKTSGTLTLSGINAFYANKLDWGDVFVVTDVNAPSTQYNGGYGVGLMINQVISAFDYINTMQIQGYAYALRTPFSHLQINRLYIESCGAGIYNDVYVGDYPGRIGMFSIQNTPLQIYSGENSFMLNIGTYDWGDEIVSGTLIYVTGTVNVVDIDYLGSNNGYQPLCMYTPGTTASYVHIHRQSPTASISAQSLPSGVGSIYYNSTPYTERIVQSGGIGVQIHTSIDTSTLPADPSNLLLQPGEGISFSSSLPSAWLWLPLA